MDHLADRVLLCEIQLSFGFGERPDGKFQVFAGMGGGDLRADAKGEAHVKINLPENSVEGVVVDTDSGQILGCAILGIEGGEIMAMLQIAMLGKLPYSVLRDGIFAHPTLAEAFNNLFGNFRS